MSYRVFTRWVTCPRPSAAASLRLFCLPFAGGGASAFRAWGALLAPDIEVCPVQLPGREDRYTESASTNVTALARAVARELMPFLDKPYAMFGHSMGALVAFEVTQALRHGSQREPEHLFLAAYPAPQAPLRRPIHELPDAAFIDEMRRLDGTPESVLQNEELMAFMLPVLRADFKACETYEYAARPPLSCPIVMYGGTEDREVEAGDLEEWRAQTTGPFSVRMLPGHHFFLQAARDQLLADMAAQLSAGTSFRVRP